MMYLRAIFLLVVVMFFYVAVAPLQWLALRRKWPIARAIPIFFHRCVVAILRVEVKVLNPPENKAPKLIAANHVSWTDISTLSTCLPVCFLSKQEVAGWPIVSTFARLQRSVFVVREQARSIVGANAEIVERMQDGLSVVIFPEGTTSDGSELGHFHSSHFAAARDYLRRFPEIDTLFVQPVAVRYSHKHVAWYGDAALLPHLLELLRSPPVQCEITFCPPVPMHRDSDRKAIAEACNKVIEATIRRL
jgi:1-acyl-sn-glycerol-3-phosphate acyltransferase